MLSNDDSTTREDVNGDYLEMWVVLGCYLFGDYEEWIMIML